MRLFISYARVDKPYCVQIVDTLDVHEVWYDRRLHAGQAWWDEIVSKLNWCEGFVYLLSPESTASEYCQKEFAIAQSLGKHLFPVLIQARTPIPDALGHIHYADLSDGLNSQAVKTLLDAIYVAERQANARKQPTPQPAMTPEAAKPPLENMANDLMAALALADAAMEAKDYDRAVFLLKEMQASGRVTRHIAPSVTSMLAEAEAALEKQTYLREAERNYAPVVVMVKGKQSRKFGCEAFRSFRQDFPNYDPENLAEICAEISVSELFASKERVIKPLPKKVRSKVYDLLPAPFEWIEIPAGKVTLVNTGDDDAKVYLKKDQPQVFDVLAFSIAKYPVTNAQFAQFIEAKGYQQKRWWTEAGWQVKEKEKWTQPRYWTDKKWNGIEQSVVGVSWYESMAFCQWLSEAAGESILLPTEQQWQRAAQGDDGRDYPWGKTWDASRCNNNVDKKGIGKTSPVRQYEGKGDSFFGVVDMSGNVWEWCLTAYYSGENNVNRTDVLVLRGGSWYGLNSDYFRCDNRGRLNPDNWFNNFGFRLALSL